VATKAPSEAPSETSREVVRPGAPPPPGADVRSSRVFLLSRSSLLGVVRRLLSIAALVVVDVAGLALGLYVALVLRQIVYGESDVFWSLLWRQERDWLQWLAPITVLVFLQAGLYAPRERRAGPGRIVASLVTVALIVLAFGLGTDYDFTTTGLIPTATVCAVLAISVLRAAYESISLELMQVAGIRRRVVLVGDGESLARIRRQIDAARGGIAYELVGAVSREPAPGLRQLGTGLPDLREVLGREQPDELVLAEAAFDERTILDVVEAAHREGVKVRLAPDTTDLLVHEGRYVPGQGVPLFELRPPALSGVDWALKRAFDLAVSMLLAVVLLPLWLLVVIAIKLDSRGPVLYVDRRVGVGEREFGMLKFRTMVAGAAEQQDELEAANEAEGALFKIKRDPRVTRVGRLLRRFSIDELPQLVNVVRGEMSLVGPRPLPLRDYALLEDWHRARYLVLPGMTGLWQISGRSGLAFDDLVRLDFAYLERWSIWLDVSIIARTIPAVIAGRGAY
jgi:exopolysaccharide biosynthesis polyprenyl glycosylphosphotransferase